MSHAIHLVRSFFAYAPCVCEEEKKCEDETEGVVEEKTRVMKNEVIEGEWRVKENDEK